VIIPKEHRAAFGRTFLINVSVLRYYFAGENPQFSRYNKVIGNKTLALFGV